MKHLIYVLGCGIAAIFLQCAFADDAPKEVAESAAAAQPTKEDTIRRGEYLVNTSACHDCHSPKRMGEKGPELIPELLLSGFQASNEFNPPPCEGMSQGWALFYPDLTASIGPWGTSFAANITSDATGIGSWTLDQFKIAIREGKSKGLRSNRGILPPMPWEVYKNMTDEDLAAIFAYLQSTKPVRNVPPPYVPLAQTEG